MARASTKENKNIYHKTREALQLTRESASELLESITPERIEKIENDGKTITKVKKLEGTDLVMELVRLTGGENDSEVAIKHAKELLANSKTYKNN